MDRTDFHYNTIKYKNEASAKSDSPGKEIDSFSCPTLLTQLWPVKQGGIHFESVLEDH